MRAIKRIFGTALLTLALGMPVSFGMPVAAGAETLADALIAAYRNSNLLDQNRAVLRAADEDVAQSISALRPIVNLRAGAVHTAVRGRSPEDGLSASLSLSAELTLLDFGRNAASIVAARESVLATRQALVGVEQEVLLAAVNAYVSVRRSQDEMQLRQANVRLIRQELRAAQDRFDVGEITRTDVSIAEARLASSLSSLAEAEGNLAVSRENYKLAVGAYPRNLSAPPRSPLTARTVEEARAIALRSHPLIRQLKHEVAVAEANVARAKAEMRPSLTLGAGLNDRRGGQDSQTLSLTLNQTLYAGGRLSSLYRQSLARQDIVKARLQQAGAQVAQGVGLAWSNLAVAQASIRATDQQVRSAQTAYDGVREEARLGARTTLDVLNAEQELLAARTTRLIAEAQRYSGVYDLLSRMGLLTADHLKLGIPTYDPDAYYNAVKSAPATSSQGKRLDRIMKTIKR